MSRLLLLTLSTLIATASHASTDLKCVSYDTIDGWKGVATHGQLVLTAKVASGGSLTPTDVEGGSAPGWFRPDQWVALGLTPEVVSWAEAAIRIVGRAQGMGAGPQL